MQQSAVVQSIDGDQAWVIGMRESSCSSCAGKSSCATLGSWNAKPVKMHVRNSMGAVVGDEVIIEVPDRFVLQATWRLYGQPMLLFLVIGLLFRHLGVAFGFHAVDALAAGSGILSVIMYYLLGRSRWLRPNPAAASVWEPRIVRIEKPGREMGLAP